VNPDKVLSLYQEFIGPQVKKEDRFLSNGRYRATKKWNNSTTLVRAPDDRDRLFRLIATRRSD